MLIQPFVISPLRSNCYVLAASEEAGAPAVIVDPGDIQLQPIFDFIQKQGCVPQTIWCTHGHFDHTLGVDLVRDRYGIPAFVHALDIPVWHEAHERASQWIGVDAPALRDPDGVWDGEQTVSLGDDLFRIVHTPGHSPGSVCFVGESIVVSGDTLFAGAIGRVDLAYSDPDAMDQSLRTVSAFPDTLSVYPGHGPSTTMARQKAINPFLRSLSCRL
jgi:hydroxyacylglutathione hydrolase